MIQVKRIIKNNVEKIYCYDTAKYSKTNICNICKGKFNIYTNFDHHQTKNHKLAVELHATSIKPIEDIKKTMLEYKMVQKFTKRKNLDDVSSTTSTLENNNDLILSEEMMIQNKKLIKILQCLLKKYDIKLIYTLRI